MSAAELAIARGQTGEFEMTERDFRLIAEVVHETAGITLPDQKMPLVYARLARRLRALGLATFGEYCARLKGPSGKTERLDLVAALTTNVTAFFREEHHFRDLRETVLPALIARAEAGGRVRLWSAGCSSGQEPYSLALTLLAAFPDAAQHDIRILATDIDPNVLATARAGRYPEEAIAPVAPDQRRRHFAAAGADPTGTPLWEVSPAARALITFRELNFVEPWPVGGPFDVILCRNVVIYFDDALQQVLWTRFAAVMPEGATLYIGHSERVKAPADGFFWNDGATIYRRGAAPAPRDGTAPARPVRGAC
ncbi:MAG: CheR family methyltransferase [Pseudomonadota bacterium]